MGHNDDYLNEDFNDALDLQALQEQTGIPVTGGDDYNEYTQRVHLW